MQLYYAHDIDTPYVTLDAAESHHCVKVMRMRIGDLLHLTNGEGVLATAHVVEADAAACVVAIDNRAEHYGRRGWSLRLAVAPTKNADRMEWLFEKAVEMGVDRFTPIVCERSERRQLKRERLEKIAVSAMKQSLKTYLPVIDDPVPLAALMASLAPDDGTCRLVCHCDGDRMRLTDCYRPMQDALVLVGPEGDFSPDEIGAALASGFHPVTLGDSRLRTETAALFATAAIHLLNQQ